MDVRGADTSSLSAKKVEIDGVRPVMPKREGQPDDEVVAHSAAKVPKLRDHPKKSSADSGSDSYNDEPMQDDEVQQDQAEIADDDGEHHVLDVKV